MKNETSTSHSVARMQWAQPRGSGREWLKQRLVRAAANVSAGLHRFYPMRAEGNFGMLMYHRVIDPIRGLDQPSINVPPSVFRKQIEGLINRGHEFWRLCDILRLKQSGGSVPDNAVVLTFDDAFHSVYDNAWPVLRELSIPATVFVSTAFLDSVQPMPFDHWGLANRTLAPPEAYRAMTSQQSREMQASGLIELGAHTHTHQDFRGRADEFKEDLAHCVKVLAEEFGVERPSFAFPYGTPRLGFAASDLVEAAKEVGVTCGLTTQTECVDLQSDSFQWGRFNVFPWDSAGTLSAKLAGWYGWAPQKRDQFVGLARSVFGRSSSAAAVAENPSLSDPPRVKSFEKPTISIVVPTFNRCAWLQDAIATLDAQQSDGQFDFEIVVVDNASSDDTESTVKAAAEVAANPVVYLHQTKVGDAPTRNCGVRHAKGQWLAFFDDDQLAEPDWLKELYRGAQASDADVVGGPVHLDLPQDDLQRIGPLCRASLREISFYPTLQPYINNDLPGTGNALVHRDVFETVGEFDESMTSGGSDSDFFLRAKEANCRLWYTPTAVIRHRISPNRMTPEYLRWDALSGGAGHAAHFDYLKKGLAYMVGQCVLRIAQAGLWQVPLWLYAKWQRDPGQALGRRTRIWRTEGYVRKTLAVLPPMFFSQTAFFDSLEFRKGRDVGIHPDDQSDDDVSPDQSKDAISVQ